MKILIAAGGSGGHIFPAIALGSALKDKDKNLQLLFVGSNKFLDRRIFDREGVQCSFLSANSLPYRISFEFFAFFLKLSFDIFKSLFIILSYRPGVVVGFGGYVSFPLIFVSRIFGIPSVVHEQNVSPGRANRLLFKMTDRVALSFEETKRFLGAFTDKAIFTGNPIRTGTFRDDRAYGIERFGLSRDKFTILVIGGSQGAHVLNKTFIEALSGIDASLKMSLQIIHITGVRDYEWALKSYEDMEVVCRVHSFIDRIEEAYSAADLVVTRSGASVIFELALLGKSMILIPYPFAMGHQLDNALVFSDKGAAITIEERGLNVGEFRKILSDLFNDKSKLKSLGEAARRLSSPEASAKLAQEVINLGIK